LRTAFEIAAQLVYLLKDKNEYKNRSLTLEFWRHLLMKRECDKCDPNTNEGKEVRRKLAKSVFATIYDVALDGAEISKVSQEAEAKLNVPRYKPYYDEYKRMVGNGVKVKQWYAMWDGPRSLEALCHIIDWDGEYEALYRLLSKTTHGESSIQRHAIKTETEVLVEVPRSPVDLHDKALMASRTAIIVCNMFVKTISQNQGLQQVMEGVFRDEVDPMMRKLTKAQIK
jgi:hypothetical protein